MSFSISICFLPFAVILLLSSLFWRQPMNLGRTVFSQLVDLLPTRQFQLCVDRYHGHRYVKDFSCWDQFLSLAFAQLTYRESLRDIEACLRAQQPKLYHMGYRSKFLATRWHTPTNTATGGSTP